MTPEKAIGTKFEIWLEILLKRLGQQNVLRNVEFRKNGAYRQADLIYNVIHEQKIKLILVEAKYSSNGNIGYKLREGEKEKNGRLIETIDNLVDEVDERRMFIGADYAVLTTNKGFDYKIKEESKSRYIKLLDKESLIKLYNQNLGLKGDIESSIKSIELKRHNLNPNIIYK